MEDGVAERQAGGEGIAQLGRVDVDEQHLDGDAARRVDLKRLALGDDLEQQVELVGGADAAQDVADGLVQSVVPAAVDAVVELVVLD